MAWKEFVVLMFLGSQFVKAQIHYCQLEKKDHHGNFMYIYYKDCDEGCCSDRCCVKEEPGPDIRLIVTCSVLGAILFIFMASVIFVCCVKCNVCLCYKRGYAGRTIVPAPVHIPLETVQPNHRLPPLERSPQVGPLYGGNTFNNYYQRGCTFVRPGLPPIRDAMGYHPPTQPPGYFDESQQPPSYDHGQAWTPSTLEHGTMGDTSRNLPPISRQGLQQTSSTIQTNQDRSRGSTEQTNQNIPPLSTGETIQNIPPRSTEHTSCDDSPALAPGQIPSIDEILQDQSRPPARLPPLTVQQQP